MSSERIKPNGDRLARRAFVLCAVSAVPFLLWVGRNVWFGGDEWAFLSSRSLGDVAGLFADHNGHWVTLPVILFRINFALFGLHSYLPYQLLVVLGHVAIAALIRHLMVRLGVRGWLATTAAVVFLLFGEGLKNIVFAFQITFNGSMICGLLALLLADHDGDDRRRDLAAVAVGTVGLATSAVMVPMVLGVGVAVLLRRGPWAAALLTAPAALTFLAWQTFYGTDPRPVWAGFEPTARFAVHMASAPFEALGQGPLAGAALAVVAFGGVAALLLDARRERTLRPLVVPAALIAAWVGLSALTAFNRAGTLWLFPGYPESGRYVHIGAALLLPVIMIGGERLMQLRRPLVLVPVVALLFGLLGNLSAPVNLKPRSSRYRVLSTAYSPLLNQAPADLKPFPWHFGRSNVTVGWLRQAIADGDMPAPPPFQPEQLRSNGLLALQQGAGVPEPGSCVADPSIEQLTLEAGDRLWFGASRIDAVVVDGAVRSPNLRFLAVSGRAIDVVAGPIDVRFTGPGGGPPPICLIRAD